MQTRTRRLIAPLLMLFLLSAIACSGEVKEPITSSAPPEQTPPAPPPPPPTTCEAGFEAVNDTCRDIDECVTGVAGCDVNATCVNEVGSFGCVCNPGFQGDGVSCVATADRCDDFAAILAHPSNNCIECHDTTPGVDGGNLDLLSPGFEVQLLNRRSNNTRCRDQLLIDASNPDNSLILKLVDPARYAAWGEEACIGSMPFGQNGVSPEDVACFEQWVQGVVDNNEAPPPPAVTPFEPMPAQSALAKVKLILHGGAVTEAELSAVTGPNGSLDAAALRRVIQGWTATPEFQNKVRSFLQLSLQQYEINPRNQPYRDQFDPIGGDDVAINRNAFFRNLEESFVRTAWNIVATGGDFRDVATTRTWQVTTAMLAGLVYADRVRNSSRFERLAHLQASDYQDWRAVTFQPATDANQVPAYANTADFVLSLRTIEDGGRLALRAPRVGFFNTPTFFESWETNEDNQFRVTTNQALIGALDLIFEAGDTTEQDNLNGLAEEHALPDTACYQCHRLMDPMRLHFENVYSYRYRVRNELVSDLTPSFAFQGFTTPSLDMDQFGQALVAHPRFPVAWVQKVCMWANSQRCVEDDPEFLRLVERFRNGYDLMSLLIDVFTSPLVTGAQITETHDSTEFFVSISRSNHLCSALQTRIRGARAERCAAERATNPDAEPRVCTPRTNMGCNANNLTRSMAALISSDAYGRGKREFIQESLSGPFNARAMTELCTQLSTREVGGGTQTFTAADVPGSIDRMVRFVMGLPPNHPRHDAAKAALERAYAIGRARPLCSDEGQDVVDANQTEITCGFGLNTTRALYIPWILACSSPELAGQGL